MIVPSREDFLQRVGGRKIPVYRDLLADVETPLSAYWKLAHNETHSFLLESVVGGEQLARYSILGIRPRKIIRSKGREATVECDGKLTQLPLEGDPLDFLQQQLEGTETEAIPGFKAFSGGAVGMLSYDLVRFFERIGDHPEDDLELPEMAMMICDTVVVFDHAKNIIRIIVAANPDAEGYDRALGQIREVAERLAQPLPPLQNEQFEVKPVTTNMTREQFESNVSRVKEFIGAGDGIQMVPSLRFCTEIDAHPITLYRALRSINPSPYMFLLRLGEFDLVGASPEILISLHDGLARVRPIAGTRWRGETAAEDDSLAEELLQDEKERAEHIMLVDLGRNDLGKVAQFGTVQVNELMVIERYSHVMHIVSDVTAKLQPAKDVFDLIRASFPAGTVSGAPKVRAMQIIDALEPTRRGAYAGAVGFIDHSGDADLCIAIRTILVKSVKAYVQAGAGVVYDADPAKEYQESCNKAKAPLSAIAMAQRGL